MELNNTQRSAAIELVKKLKEVELGNRNLIISIGTYGSIDDAIDFYLDEFNKTGFDDPDEFITKYIDLLSELEKFTAPLIIVLLAE